MSSGTLHLKLLGRFHAKLGNKTLPQFQTAKTGALLAYLVTEAAHPHERTSLVGLLWPEMPEAAALRNVTQTLLRVRKAIHDDKAKPSYLLVTRKTIQFDQASDHALDVVNFETLIEQNLTAPVTTPAAIQERIAQLDAAVNLYDGEFLTDLTLADCEAFEEWLRIKRERYQQLALNALDMLTHLNLQIGNHALANRYAQRQIALDLWQERAYQQSMQALALGGQRAAALAQYEKCRTVLRDELGVEPETATVQLYELIKAGNLRSGLDGAPHAAPNVTDDARLTNNLGLHDGQIDEAPSAPAVDTAPETAAAPPTPARSLPNNVHRQPFALVGRAGQIGEIEALLADPTSRLITVSGPGGAGKTRLALAIAERIIKGGPQNSPHDNSAADATGTMLPDGVWIVALASVGEQPVSAEYNDVAAAEHVTSSGNHYVAQAIAEALRVDVTGVQSPEVGVLNYLRSRHLLLVLDNFEHLLNEVDLLLNILSEAPHVRIIVTSRELLNVQGERGIRLGGLTLPTAASDADAARYEGVQLFIERVRTSIREFQPDAEALAHVVHICHMMEGIPLGIELAAAWVQHYSCAEIAEAIQENIDFVVSTRRDSPERHQSLRAVFDYSWALLAPAEQRTLAQLAVFRGTFSRAAAQAVTGTSVMDLAALVDKSLLRQPEVGHYAIHELLRQFSIAKLQMISHEVTAGAVGEDGKTDFLWQTYQRHAAYYLNFVGETVSALFGPKPAPAFGMIKAEMANIRQACRWAIRNLQLAEIERHISALGVIFVRQGLLQELAMLMAQIVALYGTDFEAVQSWPQLLPNALVEQARCLGYLQRYDEAIVAAGQAIEAAQAISDLDCEAGAYLFLGSSYLPTNEFEKATPPLEKSIQLFAKTSFYHAPVPGRSVAAGRAIAQYTMATNYLAQGDATTASTYKTRALNIYDDVGDRWGRARALHYLAQSHYHAGSQMQAITYWKDALLFYQEVEEQAGEAGALSWLCFSMASLGQFNASREYGEQALAIVDSLGNRPLQAQISIFLADLAVRTGAAEQALTYGQRAKAINEAVGNRIGVAQSQLAIGYALLLLSRWQEAIAIFEDSLQYWRKSEEVHYQLYCLAGLILISLISMQPDKALALIEEGLPDLDATELARTEVPLHIFLSFYYGLRVNNDDRAWAVLTKGHVALEERAMQISDAELRHKFFEDDSFNVDIQSEYNNYLRGEIAEGGNVLDVLQRLAKIWNRDRL